MDIGNRFGLYILCFYCSGIGPNVGKRATWIGASGDQSFIMIDESLITGSMLSKVNVLADKQTISKTTSRKFGLTN